MTDKNNINDESQDKGALQRKRLTFLVWVGVMAPLAISVILGLLESSNINNFAQAITLWFA